jgi:hypothetical protein
VTGTATATSLAPAGGRWRDWYPGYLSFSEQTKGLASGNATGHRPDTDVCRLQPGQRAIANVDKDEVRAPPADQEIGGAAAIQSFVFCKFRRSTRGVHNHHPLGFAEMQRHCTIGGSFEDIMTASLAIGVPFRL